MDEIPVKIMHYVNTGEVRSGGIEIILNSGAIGSCVVITAYDPNVKVGAMAHVMLPGSSSQKTNTISTKYAADAVDELLHQLIKRGTKKEDIVICLLGGANVLKRAGDTIGNDNIVSVEKLLNNLDLTVCARSLGGTERRTGLFYIETGSVYFTQGDSKEKLLWKHKG